VSFVLIFCKITAFIITKVFCGQPCDFNKRKGFVIFSWFSAMVSVFFIKFVGEFKMILL